MRAGVPQIMWDSEKKRHEKEKKWQTRNEINYSNVFVVKADEDNNVAEVEYRSLDMTKRQGVVSM